jgi:serine phosphatase RsbU (regulator of sigma subunit)
MKMARYNFEKAIQYLPENDWENLVGVYGLLGWTNTFYGDMEEVKKSIEIIEENIVKIKNPLLQSQAYHVTAVCYSLGHINPKKAVEYSLKSYALAEKSNYTLFMYSSLASRMWGYYYQGNLEKALEAIDFALELAQKNNIFVGISLYYAYQVEIFFARKDFQKAYDKAMEYLSDPKIQNDKFPALVMMRVQALYFYQQNYLDDALTVINNAITLAESTSIAYIGITLQELKAKVLEKLGQDPAPALARIKDYRAKHKGIDMISNSFKPMIALAEKTVAEKSSTFDSRASYTGSATVIKERLQLGNIIRTSQAISSILEIDELLHMVMEKTAEVTGAERGALLLVNDETGDLEYKVLHNPDDEGEEPLKISKSLIEKVKSTKKGLVMTSLGEADSTLSMTVVTEKIKSIIAAPLLVKDKLIGLLYMDSKLLNDLFSEDDLELLNVFTSQAAISIENARLHEKMLEKARLEQEMQIAKDIQTSILPFVKDTEHYEIAAFMRTATEVGGDYYDLFLKDLPHFGVFGDVSGHGLKSGLVMMMAEVAFNTIMTDEQMRNQELAGLYQKINYTLYENIQERLSQKSMIGRQYSSMYMTFRMFRFDHDGNFEIFGNDHAEPIICRQDSGEISTIPSTGFLLGIMEDAILDNQTHKFKLNPGDLLIFCSDGIAEGHKEPKQGGSSDHHREEFGEERINAIIQAHREKTPDEIIEAIVAGLDSYIHAQEDDVTLLVIKKK